MINHEKKFIHVPIPKTASQALVRGLGMHVSEEPALYHDNLEHFISQDYLKHMGYYKFSVVRNPWSRLASLWRDFTTKRGSQYSGHHRSDDKLLNEFHDFENMCVHLEDSLWSQNLFFKPQVYFLSYAGKLGMDYIGRFEDLDKSYSDICQALNIPEANLRVINETMGKNRPDKYYRRFYTERSARAVYDFYRLDIENFNYEF